MSTFVFQDKDIYYELDGEVSSDKPVLVLLNGIMMSTASWEAFKESFTEKAVLLRFDMFDQGQSAIMTSPYTQALQVEVLRALLDHLHIPTANIVGISYGASVALQFVIAYPKRVSHLILANGVAKTSSWLKAIGDGWNQVAKTRDGLMYYNITIPYIYSPQFYTTNITWMEQRKELLIPLFSNPQFLDRMTRLTISAETHDTLSDLPNITVPTLVIAGDSDVLTPRFEQERLVQEIPSATLIVFPNCGHASMYEQPELFVTTILGFIGHNQQPIIE
jgi:pimeloyl-ACP methyl ester carboxylesterase